MKRLRFFLAPMVTAAGILALSGVAMAQREGDAKGWMGGMSHELIVQRKLPPNPGYQGENYRGSSAGFRSTVRGQEFGRFQGGEAAWLRRRVSDRVLQGRQPGDRKASILLFGRVFHRHEKLGGRDAQSSRRSIRIRYGVQRPL